MQLNIELLPVLILKPYISFIEYFTWNYTVRLCGVYIYLCTI